MDPGGSAWVEVPLTDVSRKIILSGHLPFWNPHNAGGMPLAGDMVTAPFFPLKMLFLLGTGPGMWDFYLLLRLFLAGLFTFLFLRSIGVSYLGSIGSAFFYMFCGHATYHINMCPFNSELCLPGLLWASENLITKRSKTYIFVMAFFVASVFLGGLPETGFFVFLLAGSYFIFRLLSDAEIDRSGRFKILGMGIFGGLIGFCLAAPVLIPSIEFFLVGSHTHTKNMARLSLDPARMITFFVPFFYGKISYMWLKGLSKPAPYIGLVATMLAILGSVAGGKNRRRAIFFACCVIFYFLRAFDVAGTRWMGLIPLYNKVIFPRYGGAILYFSIAVLGGLGLDALVKKEKANLYLFAAIAGGIFIFIIGYYLSIKQMLSSADSWNAINPKWLGVDLIEYIRLQTLIASAFVAASVLAILSARRGLISPRITAIFLVVLSLIEVQLCLKQLERTRRYDPFVKPPIVNFLQSDTEPFRIVSTERVFYPETNAPLGLDDIRVLQALNYGRYERFVKTFLSPKINHAFVEMSPKRLASPMVNVCNIKYVVAMERIDDLLPKNFSLVYDGEMTAYANANVLPRAFIPNDVQVVHSEEESLKYLESNAGLVGRGQVAVIENEAEPKRYVKTNQHESSAEIILYEPHRVQIRARLDNDGFVVLLDSNYPGWKASLDGHATQIVPANYLFRGVRVPAGTHEIEFIYAPLSLKVGFMFLGFGLMVGLMVLYKLP